MRASIKIPYACKDGQLVHITQVDRGAKCCCTCAQCGEGLIAKKGDERTDHFSHINKSTCNYGPETILHMLIKNIVVSAKSLILPSGAERCAEIISSEEECWLGGIKPDVIINRDLQSSLLVEVAVTHKSDEQKIDKIRRCGVRAIEINVPINAVTLPPDVLANIITNTDEWKEWLFNPVQQTDSSTEVLPENSTKNVQFKGNVNRFVRPFPIIPSWSRFFKNDFELLRLKAIVSNSNGTDSGKNTLEMFYDTLEQEIEKERLENMEESTKRQTLEKQRAEYLRKSRGH